MNLTLKEARHRWCPHTPRQRKEGAVAEGNCIGDACMAWRWAEPMPVKIEMVHKSECSRRQISLLSNSEECMLCGAKAVQIEKPEQRRGYCGLAGGPAF